MNDKLKLPAAIAIAILLLALAAGLPLAAMWGDIPAEQRAAFDDLVTPRIGLVALIVFALAFIAGGLVRWCHGAYVVAPQRLAEHLRLLLGANREHRLPPLGGSEVRSLAAAANALAAQRDALEADVDAQIRQARASLEEEKNRLGALMSELTQSVVVCNLEGRILLYNNRARLQFRAFGDAASNGNAAATAGGSGALLGLGRSIFAVFDRALVAHALENLRHRLATPGSQPVTNFVTTTRAGQLIRVQMAPVLSALGENAATDIEKARTINGYVLMLDNITRSVENETRRDQILQQLTEGSRASLASIRAAVENMIDYPDLEAAQRDRFLAVIRDEVGVLSARVNDTVASYADSLKARWPLEEMLASDLLAAAQRRIEARVGVTTKIDSADPAIWVKVDSFSLLQAITYLAGRLNEDFGIRLVRFRLGSAGRMAHIDVIWSGVAVSTETLNSWEGEPMTVAGESNPLTLRDVIDRHGGELWYQRESAIQQAYFRLLVPLAAPQEAENLALLQNESRPEYYDFDLFKWSDQDHAQDDRLLSEIVYTVFDTETTGLDPSQGDEIIQIGALRIVNGRLLRQESFEQLIDPGMPLKAESVKIHGITGAMVAGQPRIEKVLPQFHRFCADTVLVAHNAAFDMRFLELKEAVAGVRFDQPVLDTLLLSAVVHPNQEGHSLEGIAERFGVTIIGRHTALGDALVTAEIFVKMIPLLAAINIRTLREAREAAQKTYFARVKY
jgi:DNA polymerase-3 subunit epsilon